MATNMASDDTNKGCIDFESISELFDEGMELYNEVMTSENRQVEGNLIRAIEVLETVTRLISESQLFTKFKTLHDVPTSHLKLFVVPALLGFLNLKTWHADRREVMYVTQTYFEDFLGRTRCFGLLDARPPGVACPNEVVETPAGDAVNCQRDAKLRRRQQQDEMQKLMADLTAKLATLEQLRNSKGKSQVSRKGKERLRAEKQMRRSYGVTWTRWLANQAIEELEVMECEKLLINYMADLNLGLSFFQEELKSKLGELPHMKTTKPVLISNGQFLQDASMAELEQLRRMLHGNMYDIVFQNPLVPFPPTPRPSTPEVTPPEELIPPVIAEESEVVEPKVKEEEPKTKEAGPKIKEAPKHESLSVEDAENKSKAKGKKKKP